MRRLLTAAVAAVLIVTGPTAVLTGPGAAVAAEPPAVPVSGDLLATVRTVDGVDAPALPALGSVRNPQEEPPPSAPRAQDPSTLVEPLEENLVLRRAHYRQNVPSVRVDTCQGERFSSWYPGGFVIDHYTWCYRKWTILTLELCIWKVLGVCLRSSIKDAARFRTTTLGVGWDGDMPSPGSPDPSYNQISFVTVLDKWEMLEGAINAATLDFSIDCTPQTGSGPCLALPGENGDTRTVAQWRADGSAFTRFFTDPADGTGRDKLSWYDIEHEFEYQVPGGSRDSTEFGPNGFRCDDASYLKGRRGCVFDHLNETFLVSLNPAANHRKAATHIWEAFNTPERTRPPTDGKDVAGNIASANPRPLSRLLEEYDPALVRAHRNTSHAACVDWWGPGYSQGGQFECDEYPMASTFQGASLANGHFSAKVIDRNDNGALGRVLQTWYRSQRILHEDHFWVFLSEGGGGGGGGDVLPDTRPTVSAGPDVAGDEGSPITLFGQARDLEGALSLRWTYRIVQAAKPGMSCSFDDPTSAVADITCNDDGVVEATLTADDGVTAPVSDTATVTVRNAPPKIEITSPEPWQVFRAGTPVALAAPFTDPGVLDTHTCQVVWDDGSTENYPANAGRTCNRTHTFAHAGMYTIEVTVTDDGGLSDSAKTMVVVYDPDAGFDNADGKLDSPAGAWTAHPTVTGLLDFHLTAKYYNPNTPTGTARAYLANTTLRMDAVAEGLQWLVVTPDGKVAAKGTATIGGQPGYGFVFYGYDGCAPGQTRQCQPGPDRFRVVLWPLSAGAYPGEDTLYDNRADAGYDIDVTNPQPLHNGAVTIHPPV